METINGHESEYMPSENEYISLGMNDVTISISVSYL